jgi:hypothetical protein
MESIIPRIQSFYGEYLPVGDRLGEMFYAIWMVVVSLGILGSTELTKGTILYVVLIAFSVNIVWGLIDGITVMHSYMLERAKNERMVFDLRTKNDEQARKAARDSLDDSVTMALDEIARERVLDLVAAGDPGEDPSRKRYYASMEDWKYAWGILAIDTFLVVPIVAPLLFWSNTGQAIFVSRLVATVIFALLGAAYAKDLHRRRWLAALFLGTICFSLFSIAFLEGW